MRASISEEVPTTTCKADPCLATWISRKRSEMQPNPRKKKFMDEIEARVAELQRRMEATSDRRRGLRAEESLECKHNKSYWQSELNTSTEFSGRLCRVIVI